VPTISDELPSESVTVRHNSSFEVFAES
jgi:hypothetical protein